MATSLARLTPRQLFGGIGSSFRRGVVKLDDEHVVFPFGRFLVVHEVFSGTQKFSAPFEDITCIAPCPEGPVLAVAEAGATPCVLLVDVLTLRRRKQLKPPPGQCKKIISLAITASGKWIAALTWAGPNAPLNLIVWAADRSRVVVDNVQLNEPEASTLDVSFSQPYEQTAHGPIEYAISVTGGTTFYLGHLADETGECKPVNCGLARRRDATYVTHAWLWKDGKPLVVTATTTHLLLITSEGEVLASLELSQDIHVMAAAGQDTVMLCSHSMEGVLFYSLQQLDSGALVLHHQEITLESASSHKAGPIGTMCVLQPQQCFLSVHTSGEAYRWDMLGKTDESGSTSIRQTQVCPPRHQDKVIRLCTCPHQPIVLSISPTELRIWHALTGSILQEATFEETILDASLHPSGHIICLAFPSRLRLMNLFESGPSLLKDMPIRNCAVVGFSHAGGFFAAAHGSTLTVYSTWTCQAIATLRVTGGRICSMHWAVHDTSLWVATVDGVIREWSVDSWEQTHEGQLSGIEIKSLLDVPWSVGGAEGFKSKNRQVLVLDNHGTCHLLTCSNTSSGLVERRDEPGYLNEFKGNVSAIIHSTPDGFGLLYGTQGSMIVTVPIGGSADEVQRSWIGPMVGETLSLLRDESILYVGLKGGGILAVNVNDKALRSTMDALRPEFPAWSDAKLLNVASLQNEREKRAGIEDQLSALISRHDYDMRLKDIAASELILEVRQEHKKELEEWNVRWAQAETLVAEYRDKLAESQLTFQRRLREELAAQHVAAAELLKHAETKKMEVEAALDSTNASWRLRLQQLEVITAAELAQKQQQVETASEALAEAKQDHIHRIDELCQKTNDMLEGLEASWKERMHKLEKCRLASCAELEAQLDQVHGMLAAAELRDAHQESERDGLVSKVQNLQLSTAHLQQELRLAQANAMSVSTVIAQEDKQDESVADYTTDQDDFRSELQKVTMELEASHLENSKLVGELSTLKTRFQGLIEELQAAVASEGTSRRAAAQTKLVLQGKEVRETRRQIQKLQNDISGMQDSIEERVHGPTTGTECKAALRTLYQCFVHKRSEVQREEMKNDKGETKSDMRPIQVHQLHHALARTRQSTRATERQLIAENTMLLREIDKLRRS